AQTLDVHGIEGERLGALHQAVEQLVVPGRGEPEFIADRLFLGPLELPPLAFEGKNTLFAFGEGRSTVLGRTDVRHETPPEREIYLPGSARHMLATRRVERRTKNPGLAPRSQLSSLTPGALVRA